jgi:predicted tellurium resistance membrane protein TerC
MEIVLGVDNIIFIAILAGKLPEEQRDSARRIGLGVALVTRLILLASLSLVLQANEPLFYLTDYGLPASWVEAEPVPEPEAVAEGSPTDHASESNGLGLTQEAIAISWRDIILLAGGLFLIAKSTMEIHHNVADDPHDEDVKAHSFWGTVAWIGVMDIVFSLDSVITAVGMLPPDQIWLMAVAIIIAMAVMLFAAKAISDFVDRNPTLKILALSFLILIGVMLTAEGLGQHIDRGYIYFAMGFSCVVELINLQIRKRRATPNALSAVPVAGGGDRSH